MKHYFAIIICLVCLGAFTQYSRAQTTYRLWADQAPGATGTGTDDIPTLQIYKPTGTANGAAFLMVPGGSYGTVVMSEADAARAFWLPKGFVIAILKYRVAPYKYPVPMYDVRRGMRMLRSKAKELGVDSNRVGILGCSAGGHLTSYLATHYDKGNVIAADPIEQYKTRPDFSVFVYPVITMDASFTHGGSRSNLLGNNPSQALVDSLSNEKQVTADTPPTFIVHGTVDNTVLVKNSQVFYDACVAKKVPAKFHKIADNCGGHGFGYTCENWGEAGYTWLKSGGYLDAKAPVSLVPNIPEPRKQSRQAKADGQPIRNVAGRLVGGAESDAKVLRINSPTFIQDPKAPNYP